MAKIHPPPPMLPDGPYMIVVEQVTKTTARSSGDLLWRVDVRVMGTNKQWFRYLSPKPSASWVWREMDLASWDDAPQLQGRVFVAMMRVEEFRGKMQYMVQEFLCEV